jgi:hypothetical protein
MSNTDLDPWEKNGCPLISNLCGISIISRPYFLDPSENRSISPPLRARLNTPLDLILSIPLLIDNDSPKTSPLLHPQFLTRTQLKRYVDLVQLWLSKCLGPPKFWSFVTYGRDLEGSRDRLILTLSEWGCWDGG